MAWPCTELPGHDHASTMIEAMFILSYQQTGGELIKQADNSISTKDYHSFSLYVQMPYCMTI